LRSLATIWSIHQHDRLVAGDERSLIYLFEHVPAMLRRRLRAAFHRAPDHYLADAAEDAVVDYAMSPSRFDSSYGLSIERYLFNAAWRNVADTLSVNRVAKVEKAILERVAAAAAALSEVEQRAVACWLSGANTASIASALGIGCLSAVEQRREVKRLKDRVIKRCRRTLRAAPSQTTLRS
jgi:hypothetical protein